MYKKNKIKLFIHEFLDDPDVTYPAYYILSDSMCKNEMLKTALTSIHSYDFSFYEQAKTYEDIFSMFASGLFPIYKEKYIVGYFGNKMMYLEPNGWKGMPTTEDIFKFEHWLVC